MPLEILGVDVHVDEEGITLKPNEAKRHKWCEGMRTALAHKRCALLCGAEVFLLDTCGTILVKVARRRSI